MDALVLALLIAICCGVGWAIRMLAADRPILGDVFRYRGPGWPRGVQEDDDMHWRWRPPAAPSTPRTERLRVHIGVGTPIDVLRRRRR